ncbi:MAG: hypothetical protein CMP22_03020 [Rickettsiales bacterium]|nr:hypothetical protein [Rickettsiales bacterium]|tara:strand:+ start:146 stop:859 length:714 start_codon:yes stop_codon:yes gene_type:complete
MANKQDINTILEEAGKKKKPAIVFFISVLVFAFFFQIYNTYEQGQIVFEKLGSPQLSMAVAEDQMEELPDAGNVNNVFEDAPVLPTRDFIDELEFSSSELEILQSLAERREEIRQKEQQLQQKEALLAAAEKQIDAKYSELNELRTEIEKLLGQQQEEQEERIKSLVRMYETMKSKDAARILDTLDMEVLISVMSRMSERKAAPILASMDSNIAREVTIKLAEQKKLPDMNNGNEIE